jgi:D-alanyl-D-alanine carboxypeptidase
MNKSIFFILLATILFFVSACQKDVYQCDHPAATDDVVINRNHPMKDSLEAIIDKYVDLGIPGVQVAVKNADGWYITGGGYAKIEDKSPLSSGMKSWYFSLTKTYTASLAMQLWEEGQLQLDAPIGDYLAPEVAGGIAGSPTITVRMLLNHSSGIVNFTELPAFQLGQLNNPLDQPTLEEKLELVYGQPLLFTPGSDFSYSNTNYLLMHLIIEKASGKTYEQLLKDKILQPLGLQHTHYNLADADMASMPFPNYYFDRFANEQLENITMWNMLLGNTSLAYGGIAGTAADAIRFYEALNKGQVVGAAALAGMRTWIQGHESTQPDYGLGLEYYQYGLDGDAGQYGHEGDGIGCTTQMMYVPANDTYLYINITAGRQLFGPYLFKTTDFKIDLCRYTACWRP